MGAKPAAGAQALHPYRPHTVDVLKYYGAKNGNVAFVGGQHSSVAASDTVVTGLATVAGVVASYDTDPADANLYVSASIGNQAGAPAAGSVYLKQWKTADGADPTPAAASSFSKKINWIAWGTPAAGRDDAPSANVNI